MGLAVDELDIYIYISPQPLRSRRTVPLPPPTTPLSWILCGTWVRGDLMPVVEGKEPACTLGGKRAQQ